MEKYGAGEDAARLAHQSVQEQVFGFGQTNGCSRAKDPVCRGIERQTGHLQFRHLLDRSASGHGSQPRQQYFEGKRFGQIIVSAGVQTLDDIFSRVTRREHEDGCTSAGLAQTPSDVEPVRTGQHDVEDDDVEPVRSAQAQAFGAAERERDRMAFFLQTFLE